MLKKNKSIKYLSCFFLGSKEMESKRTLNASAKSLHMSKWSEVCISFSKRESCSVVFLFCQTKDPSNLTCEIKMLSHTRFVEIICDQKCYEAHDLIS